MIGSSRRGALLAPGLLLGAGLGGFLDGILFHQILQWHNMLSNRIVPSDLVSMKYNMLYDGLFHALTWIVTVAGLALLWRAGSKPGVPWSARTFVGALAVGWGFFNLVEGVINHHILEIHHVHPGVGEVAWDLGFLAFGAVLAGGGLTLIRHDRENDAPRSASAHAGGTARTAR